MPGPDPHLEERMTATRTLLLCAALLGAAVAAHADDPEARALVTQVRDSVPTEPMVAKATLKGSGGWVRELTMSHKQIGDDRASLLEVTAPGDVAGSRYLFLERTEGGDRQFMYLPKLTARVIEVMDAARHEPFLGSDFYVSDLMAPDVAAFTYAFVGDEEILDRPCRLVEATAKPDAGLYQRGIEAGAPADVVDRLEAAGRYQPGTRTGRHAIVLPLLQRCGEGIVQSLFGEFEIAEQTDQSRQNTARFIVVNSRDCIVGLVGRNCFVVHRSPGSCPPVTLYIN
jgi:hypothetical protein